MTLQRDHFSRNPFFSLSDGQILPILTILAILSFSAGLDPLV